MCLKKVKQCVFWNSKSKNQDIHDTIITYIVDKMNSKTSFDNITVYQELLTVIF
jgi:hypothetical protein